MAPHLPSLVRTLSESRSHFDAALLAMAATRIAAQEALAHAGANLRQLQPKDVWASQRPAVMSGTFRS